MTSAPEIIPSEKVLEEQPAVLYVLEMFSYFEQRNRGMAFSAKTHELTRAQVAAFTEETLNAYLDGREKAYAVRYALNEVVAVFGAHCLAVGLIEKMLVCQDEALREASATKAVDLLFTQARSGLRDAQSE